MPSAALATALLSIARWRAAEPAHALWVGQGALRLTEREHVERFGKPYKARR